ncbi:RNA polymerase sigma factor SigB, partial [Listeria monocytogenes]|nr:RNA polymerase sigma factor SigB [Listeria monocytogenes]
MPKVSQPAKEAKEKVYIWIAAYQETGDQDAQYNLVVHYKNLVASIAR